MKVMLYKILTILFVVYIIGLGSWGLSESSEARYAEISREMVMTNDYMHPTLLGIKHYHKPPVTYYITALGYQIFGVNEFGARFFLGIALIVQLLLVYKIGQQLFKQDDIAIVSMIIYLSFPVVMLASTNLTTDMYLTTFILCGIYCWLAYRAHRNSWFMYAFYVFMGLGFLTKGPVVLLFPFVFIAVWKIVQKESIYFSVHDIFGIVLFLVISASWYLLISIEDPKVFDYFFKDQLIDRASSAGKFHRSKPFWFYVLTAPLIGFPWFVFIVRELVYQARGIIREKSIALVLSITIVLLLIVFSLFSSKLIFYILPIYIFISLLGGSLFFKISEKVLKSYMMIIVGLSIFLFSVLTAGSLLGYIHLGFKWIALMLLFTVIGAIYIVAYIDISNRVKILSVTFHFTICLIISHTIFSSSNPSIINSFDTVVSFVKQKKKDSLNHFIVYNNLLPSTAFYLDKDIITINNGHNTVKRETQFETNLDYKNTLIDMHKADELALLKKLMKEQDNVLVLKKESAFPDSLQYMLKVFKKEKDFGKWKLYY